MQLFDRHRYCVIAAVTVAVLAASAFACSSSATKDAAPTTAPTASASTATAAPSPRPPAAAGPATFSVIAGRNDGAYDIERFMPADVHVREGDTVEWTARGIEGHTVSFVTEDRLRALLGSYLMPDPAEPAQTIFNPGVALRTQTGDTFAGDGTFYNSGFFGVPAEQKYALKFARQGLYQYICLVHPFTMRGSVSVDAAAAAVESPDSVAQRGSAELAAYIAEEKRAVAQAAGDPHELPGPAGSTLHRVNVGVTTPYGQAATFVPPALDIRAGDTVIFENDDRNFHNVIFKGERKDPPPGIGIIADPAGRGLNFSLDKQSAVAVDPPPGGFDDKTFLSSGSMGILQPRLTWRLKFDRPGTYSFACTIHVLAGMAGVIIVR